MPDVAYSPRLRTGVVLSGVGTAGAYQAGALRALSEAGIKVDVVAAHGAGVLTALAAAVDGGARLWDPATGPWTDRRLRRAYRWRTALRLGMAGLAALGLAITPQPVAADEPKARRECLEFSELALTLERNATDGDTEVVIFAKGQDTGLKRLTVTAPNGRTVAAFQGSQRGIGIREFVLESAEPPDLDAVLSSFPEGEYQISGRTVDGECIKGTVSLSHQIAPETTLLTPGDEEAVSTNQLVLSWAPVPGAERYIVELNNEDTGGENTFTVFPPTTSLAIPAHFLQPGSEYQFGVGVKATNGNITFVERTFFTAP